MRVLARTFTRHIGPACLLLLGGAGAPVWSQSGAAPAPPPPVVLLSPSVLSQQQGQPENDQRAGQPVPAPSAATEGSTPPPAASDDSPNASDPATEQTEQTIAQYAQLTAQYAEDMADTDHKRLTYAVYDHDALMGILFCAIVLALVVPVLLAKRA